MPLIAAGTARLSPVEFILAADAPLTHVRVRDGKVHIRVRAGVYAEREVWDRLKPWDRYLARVHAFALVHPGAIFSHESAAVLLGMPIFGEPLDIHVYDPGRKRSRRFGDVCVHTSRDAREIEVRGALRTTTAVQTAVDLMRVLPPAFALAVGCAAISPAQGGAASIDDLRAVALGEANARGRAQLTELWSLLDPRIESPGEAVSLAVMRWVGFADPELQVVVASEGYRDRVDFGWRRVMALGESDGYEKYRGETAEEAVKRIIDEKRREERLRRSCRAFDRWDMAAALGVTVLTERLDGMAVPRVRSPRPGLLATLSSNPRSIPVPRNQKPAEKPRTA